MEWVETTGRTVADALDSALDELGVHEEDVEVEVLEEPKSGFLGRFGGSDAARPGPSEADLAREARRPAAPQGEGWALTG